MKISECCGAELIGSDVDPICSECKEHAEAVDDSEVKRVDIKVEVESVLAFMQRQKDKGKHVSGVSISVNDSDLLARYISELVSTLANRDEHIARLEKYNAVKDYAIELIMLYFQTIDMVRDKSITGDEACYNIDTFMKQASGELANADQEV